MTRSGILLMALACWLQGVQPALAQTTITIRTPGAGQYVLRQLQKDGKIAAVPVEMVGPVSQVLVDARLMSTGGNLAIDDSRSGLTAMVKGPSVRVSASPLVLKASDFSYVRQVLVEVKYKGRPVRTARVALTDAKRLTRTAPVDPLSRGTASFEDVRRGKAKLAITYGSGLNLVQDVLLAPTPAQPVPTFRIEVPNPVPTLAPDATGASPSAEQVKKTPTGHPGSPITALAGLVLGVALSAGIIYGLYRWAISGSMATTLKGIGIETEGPQASQETAGPWQPKAPPTPVVADPSLCPYCGQTKGVDGGCACVVGEQLAATPVAPQTTRLVAITGQATGLVINISGPTPTTLGRDPDNTVVLADDTTVSRKHACLKRAGTDLVIEDCGSSNGVLVNGLRITGPRNLVSGDEVQVGNTRYRVEV